MKPIVLQPGEIHFFYTLTNEIQNKLLLDKYLEVTNKKEKSKINRYVFEKDRHNCLVTRGLQRFVLSQCTNIPPESFEFEENSHGKPDIKPGVTNIPIRFNLSHAKGLTACAVILNHEIGIDVEDSTRKINLNIADRFFSSQESEYILNKPEHKKKETFFDFWTLKESYIKAKGKGLAIPLTKFSFKIDNNKTSIYFDESYNDNPANLTFFRFPLVKRFKAAITIQAPENLVSKVNIYHCIPFKEIKIIANY